MTEFIDETRRRFLRNATLGVAAAVVSPSAPAGNQSQASFGALRQIDAGDLSVGYAEVGPAKGAPVVLLHGWPYDIHSYADVAPLLAVAGYRVIIPYLRGYGTTRFRSDSTPRNGQQAALALDVVALMDALKIRQATSPAMIGAHVPRTSSRPSGQSAASRWCRSAVI